MTLGLTFAKSGWCTDFFAQKVYNCVVLWYILSRCKLHLVF